jgi:hypothetical protein
MKPEQREVTGEITTAASVGGDSAFCVLSRFAMLIFEQRQTEFGGAVDIPPLSLPEDLSNLSQQLLVARILDCHDPPCDNRVCSVTLSHNDASAEDKALLFSPHRQHRSRASAFVTISSHQP